ncbi:MAG: DUF2116 family Zn-ribbon domain-containing protein [Candidatus Hodarchaeota archaeon]
MSKFERYTKQTEEYIYPHKHCKKCGEMIEEGYNYCPDCYKKMKEKKKRRWLIFKRKEKNSTENS